MLGSEAVWKVRLVVVVVYVRSSKSKPIPSRGTCHDSRGNGHQINHQMPTDKMLHCFLLDLDLLPAMKSGGLCCRAGPSTTNQPSHPLLHGWQSNRHNHQACRTATYHLRQHHRQATDCRPGPGIRLPGYIDPCWLATWASRLGGVDLDLPIKRVNSTHVWPKVVRKKKEPLRSRAPAGELSPECA